MPLIMIIMKYTDVQIKKLREAIGASIVEERKQRGWTQFDLAMASGCRPEAISRIERGVVDFGISNLFRLAAALEIEPFWLLPTEYRGGLVSRKDQSLVGDLYLNEPERPFKKK